MFKHRTINFAAVLVQMGMSEQFAKLLLEMIGALNSGYMRALEPRTPQNTTPKRYETFVADYFVPAYNNKPQPEALRRRERAAFARGSLLPKSRALFARDLKSHDCRVPHLLAHFARGWGF